LTPGKWSFGVSNTLVSLLHSITPHLCPCRYVGGQGWEVTLSSQCAPREWQSSRGD
jgi:hypothetical protein